MKTCAACQDSSPAAAIPAQDGGNNARIAALRRFTLDPSLRREIFLVVLAGAATGAALLLRWRGQGPAWLPVLIYGAAYILAGRDVLLGAARNILRGRVFDELFLMSVATVGAFVIGQYPEAVGVMVFYKVGEALQESAASRSRAAVRGLLALRPDTARIRRGDAWVVLPAAEAVEGDIVLVLPGERVPVDGMVTEGEAFLDSQALTGEPRPSRAFPGAEVLAASLSLDGAIELRASRPAGESSAARIALLVEEAAHAKARSERFISRFAKVYTPGVAAAALVLAFLPPLLGAGSLASWAYRALVLLVISCPCALVISVPLGYFGGIGGLARRGILVKGGSVLDALAAARCAVFDKTGTLTKGVFKVLSVEAAPGFSEDGVLELAASAESRSRHPIAASIREAARGRGLSDGTEDGASSVRETPGLGVTALLGGRRVAVGSEALLDLEAIPAPAGDGKPGEPGATRVLVASDGRFAGRLLIGDAARPDARRAVAALRELGVGRVIILTGDSEPAARPLAAALGIREVRAGLLPEGKLAALEDILAEERTGGAGACGAPGGTTLFVGDGVNDAPVLARADVGIAMGAGADVALECADVVLMTDEPSRVAEAVEHARRTRRIVRQNIFGSLAFKAAFLALGALGLAGMWEALVADVGVALLATLNSTRALRA